MGGRLLRAEPVRFFAGPFLSQTNLGATLQTLGHLPLACFSFALCSCAHLLCPELWLPQGTRSASLIAPCKHIKVPRAYIGC